MVETEMSQGLPIWEPSPDIARQTTMAAFLRRHNLSNLDALLARADAEPHCSAASRDDDRATRARLVSATPASSDETSATSKPRRAKGSKLDADEGSNLQAD